VRFFFVTPEKSPRKDHFKVALQKNPDQDFVLPGETRGNKRASEYNREMLRGLSMQEPQGSVSA
jgi:hypothetical protein